MAGSYDHIIDERGNLLDNEAFADMIENLGDAYEMAEQLYGMIWFLASYREDTRHAIEQAREHYQRGIVAARHVNGVGPSTREDSGGWRDIDGRWHDD